MDAETALSDLYAKYKARDEMVNTLEDEVYRLMQENEKLREKIEDARLEGYAKGLGEMSAELEQVKRERDAAEQFIKEIANSGRVWMCPYCVHAKDTTGGIAECELGVGVCMMPYSKFEWRGIKEG